MKCLVWSVALYTVETRTLTKVDVQRLEASEMWIWQRMEKLGGWTKFQMTKCWQWRRI